VWRLRHGSQHLRSANVGTSEHADFAIGMKESLFFKDLNNLFDSAIPAHKIFKKRN